MKGILSHIGDTVCILSVVHWCNAYLANISIKYIDDYYSKAVMHSKLILVKSEPNLLTDQHQTCVST